MTNLEQLKQISNAPGFIAALDQSGGSTPKALAAYGVTNAHYSNEAEMFGQMHAMRSRIMQAACFNRDKVIGAILFERTMNEKVLDVSVSEYLWETKGVVPFLKCDKGLLDESNGVQLMAEITGLSNTLDQANDHKIFGTKMRSVIQSANAKGIADIVAQQFDVAKQIIAKGLCPIIEPEVNITIDDKADAEAILHDELVKGLAALSGKQKVMLKLSLPSKANHYRDFNDHPNVVRVVALSGGYSAAEAAALLAQNDGMIASFSRALTEGLQYEMSDSEFEAALDANVSNAFNASV